MLDEKAKKNRCTCEGEPMMSIPLTLSPSPLLESGRVSFRGYIQLFPRWPGFFDKESQTYIPSFRECIEPMLPTFEEIEVPDDYVLQPGEELVN